MERIQPNTENDFSSLNPKKKQKRTILIIVSIIIILIALGIGIIHFVDKREQDYNNDFIESSIEEKQSRINSLFSLSEYDKIPAKNKEHIYDFMEYNGFLDGAYFLTKISDRAKNVFAFGDFTSDDNDEDDIAVLFEKNDFSSSKLVIFNHKGELLYVEDYSNELPIINSYKVGSKIYMDEAKLVPSPCDGMIIKTEYNKRALVYDKKSKKFKTYYQYTKEDLDAMNREEYYDDGYEDYEEAPLEPDSTMQVNDFTIQEVK